MWKYTNKTVAIIVCIFNYLNLLVMQSGLGREHEYNKLHEASCLCFPIVSQTPNTLFDIYVRYLICDFLDERRKEKQINKIGIWSRQKRVNDKPRRISRGQITNSNKHHGNVFRFDYENCEFILNYFKI